MRNINHPPNVNSRESYIHQDGGHKREPEMDCILATCMFKL